MITSLQIGQRWSSKTAGGSDRVFADLYASLPGAGVKFIGAVTGPPELSRTSDGLIYSFASEDSSTLARFGGARRNLSDLMDSMCPDLVASHFALYTAPILDKLSSRPLVLHFHGPWAEESKLEGASSLAVFSKFSLERLVYRRADRAIVLSKAFGALLNRVYGVEENKIRIVPGSVDLQRFEPVGSRTEAREALGWPSDRPIILSVRRLYNRMGLHQLIDSMTTVRKQIPEVLLYIGGTGPIRQSLEQRVNELGISTHVRFLGFVPDENLPLAYRAADMSVVPTAALEGFGLVAAESLAAGTPTMVTPVGGLPEVVNELSEILVFRSGSPQDIAMGLSAALRGEIRMPTDTECREYAVRNFSRELMASRVAAVYREIAR